MPMIKLFQQNQLTKRLIYMAGRRRAQTMVEQVDRFLAPQDQILDVGCGTGNVCELLQERGCHPTPLDVQDLSFVDGIDPVLFDGVRFPFPDDSFDVALIMAVLHHTPDPLETLRESRRVARRLIVIEDVYDSTLHKIVTQAADSVFNLELWGHPHNNKTDLEWRQTFKEVGLRLLGSQLNMAFGVFKLATYHLEKVPLKAARPAPAPACAAAGGRR
jgi:SAM-dependent methyltransferase